MKTLISIFILSGIVVLAGCKKDDNFSRYPSVAVPEYSTQDYLADLNGSNPEIIYNAICQLGLKAHGFSKTICGGEDDPDSEEYKTAQLVYDAVAGMVESEHDPIAAVSLRFLQVFAKHYTPRDELLSIALKSTSSHPQVLFEKIALMNLTVQPSSQLPDSLISDLMNNDSWIISRSSYRLAMKADDETARLDLIKRYEDADTEKERLVILRTWSARFYPEEYDLIKHEFLTTPSSRIHKTAFETLKSQVEQPEVIEWICDNFQSFTHEEQITLFEFVKEKPLAARFIEHGFQPDDEMLNNILKNLQKEDKKDTYTHLDDALSKAPQTSDKWIPMKAEIEVNKHRLEAVRNEVAPVATGLLESMKEIQKKHGIPDEDVEYLWELMFETLMPEFEKMEQSAKDIER